MELKEWNWNRQWNYKALILVVNPFHATDLI